MAPQWLDLEAFNQCITAKDTDRRTAEIQIPIAQMNRFSAVGGWPKSSVCLKPKEKGDSMHQGLVTQQVPFQPRQTIPVEGSQ